MRRTLKDLTRPYFDTQCPACYLMRMVADHSFLIGDVPIGVLPIDMEDLRWFIQSLEARGFDTRRGRSRELTAALELATASAVVKFAADQLPAGTHAQMQLKQPIDIAAAAGVSHLVRVLRRIETRDRKLFELCWSVVFGGAPLAVPQQRTQNRDHAWEFVNAAIASEYATKVAINQLTEGVDVTCDLADERWGIECKMIYTRSPNTRIDRIIDGVKQIERDSSIVRGVVAVNVTNCIDHSQFQKSLTGGTLGLRTLEQVTEPLKTAVRDVVYETQTAEFRRRWLTDKDGHPRRKCRALLFVGQTIALAAGRVILFSFQYSLLRKPADARDKKFVNRYHRGSHVFPVH